MKSLVKNENLKSLNGKSKIQYIWDYYKLPLALFGILLYILVYISYNHFTHKDTILYAALVNVNAGDDLTEGLSDDFVEYLNLDPSKNRLELYTGLYLTDDEQNAYFQYAYASRMKILAAIDGEVLDIVLMNQEAFDAFSQNGYLYDLEDFLLQTDSVLYDTIKQDFAENITILDDNFIELQLDPSVAYHAITEEHYYGIDLSHTELIRNAGFKEPVYLGILANSPRRDSAVSYLKYLFTKR
ncbi:MAG: hypothetical protein K2N44_05100 [Lachnospiraceae bacterium]|nr:hypothetical protein [Lachnospiraceae bacterium]